MTLYDVLVEAAKELNLEMNEGDPCMVCAYSILTCTETDCQTAVIDTLQSIALAAGFDLKKVVK